MATRTAYGLDSPRAGRWEERAACRPGTPVDPEWWWPLSSGPASDTARALHICRSHCPVVDECRRVVEEHPPAHPTVQGGVRYVVNPRNHYQTVRSADAGHADVDGCPYCKARGGRP
ncbi:WhiB family transcriptional regulator [Micromonospora haikouensis]|uniref:WhiB family transcriptional regulator n=1 Tax=Micromonospora haikouensis TaxID=686309 RepID=UPI003678E66F